MIKPILFEGFFGNLVVKNQKIKQIANKNFINTHQKFQYSATKTSTGPFPTANTIKN